MPDPLWRHIPDLLACFLVLGVHYAFGTWTPRRAMRVLIWTLCAWVIVSLGTSIPLIARHLTPSPYLSWFRGAGIAWGLTSLGIFILGVAWRKLPKPEFNPERRHLLNVARTAVVVAPVAATGFGVFVERNALSVREVDIPIKGLPKDLDGLRIVQLTDIHCSAFLSRKDVARAVNMANSTRANVAVLTGDLITSLHDPLDDCLAELSRLRSDAGTFGCLGNHEIYANAEAYTTEQGARLGMRFLRGEARRLRFGNAHLNLAGVDYQRMRHPYLEGAEQLIVPGDCNLLLSHNPDVFPVADSKGFHLTLAGHTHGGQITVEILEQYLTVARFFTPYVYGAYKQNNSSIYVSRGIGTVGVPARLGAPPEVSLIRLCAI